MTEFVFLVRNAPIKIEAILLGREDRIRTCDPLVPNQVRYRPALLPDCPQKNFVFKGVAKIKINSFTKGFILFFIE
jgi:hypothetical protein